jgi:hypothetical protein
MKFFTAETQSSPRSSFVLLRGLGVSAVMVFANSEDK